MIELKEARNEFEMSGVGGIGMIDAMRMRSATMTTDALMLNAAMATIWIALKFCEVVSGVIECGAACVGVEMKSKDE